MEIHNIILGNQNIQYKINQLKLQNHNYSYVPFNLSIYAVSTAHQLVQKSVIFQKFSPKII